MTRKAPTSEELLAFEAMLEGVDSIESALDRLGGRTDPESAGARLLLLIRGERFEEAAKLARELPPHRRWLDKAILALAADGDITQANTLLTSDADLRREDFLTFCKCVSALSEGALAFCARSRREPNLGLTPISLKEGGTLAAVEVVKIAASLVEHFKNIPPSSPLEVAIVENVLTLAFLGSVEDVTQSCAEVLKHVTPCSKGLAKAIIRQQAEPIADLPHLLRTDYPNDFEALCLAALIQGMFLDEPEKAVFWAMALAKTASPHQKEELGRVLYQLLRSVPDDTARQARSVLETLWPPDSRFSKLLAVEDCFVSHDLVGARTILTELEDPSDAYWLQLDAQCSLLAGDQREALASFLKAIELVPHPELLKQVASVAARSEDWDTALVAMDKLRRIYPSSVEVLLNQASVLIKRGDHGDAAECFKRLGELQPDEVRHKLNEALSRARAGDLAGSLLIYEQIAEPGELSLEVLLSKAQVLGGLNRSIEAFDLLSKQKDGWWGNAQFVAHYMSLGYRTENEEEAFLAFDRLKELDSIVEPDKKMLKAVSLDDLKAHMAEYNERRDFLLTQLLQGKLPWLMVDSLLRNVPYLAWAFRTQPLRWLSEAPLRWAQENLYASHSFAVLPRDGEVQLVELEAATKGTPVVIDLSSLITLHQLNLLQEVAEYFGQIYFPAAFLTQILEDATKLSPHQLSQYTAPNFIRSSVESKRLSISSSNEPLPFIDEHTDSSDGRHRYGLIDLVAMLYSEGVLGEEEYKRLQKVCHRPSAVDDTHPPLRFRQKVRFALSTLETLNTLGFGDEVLDSVMSEISSADYDEAVTAVRAFGFQEKVAKWHSQMWDSVRAEPRFIARAEPTLPKSLEEQSEESEGDDTLNDDTAMWPAASAVLALALRIPLFADDRASQVMFWSALKQVRPNAFGTNQMIDALHAEGILSPARAAEAYLKLIRWRYRFIVLPPPVLKTLADQFRNFLPGRHLREVATYVQDSMSDPGLCVGFEPTKVPTSMANSLFHAWIRNVACFLGLVWQDSDYSDDHASSLTRWTVSCLLPAVSLSGRSGVQRMLAEMTPKSLFSTTLIQLISVVPEARAHLAIRTIAKCFALSDEEYMTLVSEVIDVDY